MPPIGLAKIEKVGYDADTNGSIVFWRLFVGLADGTHELEGSFKAPSNPSQAGIEAALRTAVMNGIQAAEDVRGAVPQSRIMFQTGQLG